MDSVDPNSQINLPNTSNSLSHQVMFCDLFNLKGCYDRTFSPPTQCWYVEGVLHKASNRPRWGVFDLTTKHLLVDKGCPRQWSERLWTVLERLPLVCLSDICVFLSEGVRWTSWMFQKASIHHSFQPRSNDPCVDPCVVFRLTLPLFPVLNNQSIVCLLVSLFLFGSFLLI